MAQEKIQAIKKAELDAAKSIKDAQQKKEDILNDAVKESMKIKQDMTRDVELKSENSSKEVTQKNEDIMKSAIGNAEAEIANLKSAARSRQAEATKLVLEEII